MNPVQQKIACVYDIAVSDESSSKRYNQTYKVLATGNVNALAEQDGIFTSSRATEKLDGTCCLIQEFQGRPWLWARYDRKPSKAGERKLAVFKRTQQKLAQNGETTDKVFTWNPEKDFKEPPQHWVPASKLEIKDGIILPDSIGHTPGWLPVQVNCRQQCWHLSAVDLEHGLALVLRIQYNDPSSLILESQPLSTLLGQTCELIGTNINGNPYNLGSKLYPVHVLVPHGSIPVQCPIPSDYTSLLEWFSSESSESQIEGIVWHCENGALYKVHRHHLNLKWPLTEAHLCQKKVLVQINLPAICKNFDEEKEKNLLHCLSALNGKLFQSLQDIQLES